MTLSEFRCWHEGYLAAKGKKPLTESDYKAIVKKMEEIEPAYCPHWHVWYTTPQIVPLTGVTGVSTTPNITFGTYTVGGDSTTPYTFELTAGSS